MLGAAPGAILSPWLPSGPVAVGLSILVAVFLSRLLRLQDAARLAGYVCAIVVLDHQASPWSYAVDRLAETLLGIGTAMLVSLVPKLLSGAPARSAGP